MNKLGISIFLTVGLILPGCSLDMETDHTAPTAEVIVDSQGIQWYPTGLWHNAAASQCTDGAWAYFGMEDSCTYNQRGSTRGTLTSSDVEITSGTAVLVYSDYRDVMDNDYTEVAISVDGGETWDTLLSDDVNNADVTRAQHVLSLREYAGRTVNIRFLIVTEGRGENIGWSIADIKLLMDSEPVGKVPESGDGLKWGEHEIDFYAQAHPNSTRYISWLKICGTNQYGDYVCWERDFEPWTISSYHLRNWWWKMDLGVALTFYLDGYGYRYCSVDDGGAWWDPSLVRVTYWGNYICTTQ